MSDLPFLAEYAKSGRASCKFCKSPIAKDSLRLAKMIQSPHFDGKVPNWFHERCFYNKAKPKSVSDIDKFDQLRWDDQEKIRTKLGGAGGASGGGDAVDGGGDGGGADSGEFSIEYSKSSRANCRKCNEKIEKGDIRLSKMMLSESSGHVVPHWHHLACFILVRDELDASNLTPDKLPGMQSLSADHQADVNAKLGVVKKIKQENGVKKPEPATKTNKLSTEEQKLKKQSKDLWRVNDSLKTMDTRLLKEMLSENGYRTDGVAHGLAKILERCCDGIMFGALEPCPECKEGQLMCETEGYKCTGSISAWSRCLHTTKDPKRKVWQIPDQLKDESFFKKLNLKVRRRVFASTCAGNTVKDEKEDVNAPLANRSIVFIGRIKLDKAAVIKNIESLGGSVSDKLAIETFCCISSPGEVMKGTQKMVDAEKFNIPVVAEEYVNAIAKGGARTMLAQYAIAPWGGKKEGGIDGQTATKSGQKRKLESVEGSSKKAKITLKGGVAVDPDSGVEDTCHVYTRGESAYTVVLGAVDITKGTNSYYKLQILQHDTKKSKFFVFRAWGRVGTSIGGNKLENFGDATDAVESFKEVYLDKTGNQWQHRARFEKQPFKFYPIDIDYGQDDDDLQSKIAPGSESKLPSPVQELMKLIFDLQAMKDALVEFEIDLKKMPLGKLSKKQIQNAYSVLTEIEECVKSDAPSQTRILDASNRFFTLIPHDFGLHAPPLLDSHDLIRMKIAMLDSLLEIEIAYNLLKGSSGDQEKDPLDAHYEKLKTDIKVVDKTSSEFDVVNTYLQNTHAKTHSQYTLELEELFAVVRDGEKKKFREFQDLPNRQLLWHGSRVTNYAGILAQGLRIAPPEAPSTGYMFGKGVYFADMSSKSANYCFTNRTNNTGLLLLCDVALGNMFELNQSKFVKKLPGGKHSTKGCGTTMPDPSSMVTLDNGTIVPSGVGIDSNLEEKSSLLYNEYIVYDTSQINMKYLVKVKFNYK